MNPEELNEELGEEARIAKELQEVNDLPEVKQMQENLRKLAEPENTEEDYIDNKENNEEETPHKTKKEVKGDRYRKLQNDKYRALAEKEEANRRADKLEQMLRDSLNSGTYHYGKSVYAELERAKEDKRYALENGDVDALIDADLAINKALYAVNDLEKWGSNTESSNSSYEPDVPNNEVYTEIATDWLDSHPYLQPHSQSYNSKVAEKVYEFINYLDYNLQKSNETDAIFSEDYFSTIDNYIDSLRAPKKDTSRNIESLSNVSGVRNSTSSNRNRPITESEGSGLSRVELKMIKNSASSPEEEKKMISDWVRNKKEVSINRNRG